MKTKTINLYQFHELTDYLRGVKDMINMLNGEESSCGVASYIIGKIDESKLEYELPF